MTTLKDDLRVLHALRQKKDETDKAAKLAKSEYEQAERRCLERMEAEGCKGYKDGETGINFIPTETIYGQIDNREQFVEWAKENDPTLIEERERKGLINELVRERIDNEEPLPPGVTFRPKRYIGQRAA